MTNSGFGVTIVTGASSGLGAGMARELARRGHELALFARRADKLQSLADEVETESGVAVTAHSLDVTDHDAVFAQFRSVSQDRGGLARVVVNAGIGKGARVGTGRFAANRDTLATNVIAALAQIEAAMEIFYEQGHGQLVVMSSVTSGRGLPGPMNAYAAGKSAVTHIADGVRLDVAQRKSPIRITTLHPGYIDSEMQDRTGRRHRLQVDADTGARALVDAIERGRGSECVPRWPWTAYRLVVDHAPRRILTRIL
ncbi:SDR family oxidoreductase [Dietzia psychralcaliphila]|uniref:SDR family oxidoreductase n=1 Tax=Dietzia psychralcaliphila TaxID=139021 RepID=UPI001C1E6721|nr:SDR family oxidoreductase [Dietzia psychralcaliphila]